MIEAAAIQETGLPPVGYSIPEVEHILSLPQKSAYRLIKEGKLNAFLDSTGRLKVHQYQVLKYMEEKAYYI